VEFGEHEGRKNQRPRIAFKSLFSGSMEVLIGVDGGE